MMTVIGMVLYVVIAAPPAPDHKASDVELIANWVYGKDPGKVFPQPFGDSKILTDRKEPLLYSDVPGVSAPAGMRAVNYEFVQARMRTIRGGGDKTSPAVLIVRSSLEEPDEGGEARAILRDKDKLGGRVYYVEVAIGNLAWHWLKVIIRDEGDKLKAEIIWKAVS